MLDPRWLAVGLVGCALTALVFYAGDQWGYAKGHAEATAVHELWNAQKSNDLARVIHANAQRDHAVAMLDEVRRESHANAERLARARADDAAASRAAGERLQRAFAAQLTACGSAAGAGASPVGPGQATPGVAPGVLAGVFGGVDESAGVVAAVADDARARGLQCEAEYSALALALRAAGRQAEDRQHGQQQPAGAQAREAGTAEGRAIDPRP
jgi:hypothetical protein